MKRLPLFFLCVILPYILFAQAADKDTYQTVDNILLKAKDYAVQVKYSNTEFTLKVWSLTTSVESRPIAKTVPKATLYAIVVNLVKTLDTGLQDSDITTPEKTYLMDIKDRVLDFIQQDEILKKSEQDQITVTIDNSKDQHTGQLKLLKDITDFKITQPTNAKIRKYYSHLYNKTEVNDEVEYKLKNTNSCTHENDVLQLIDATVIFFNNKASTIALNAILKCSDKVVEDLEFYNFRYSIPIRAFTYYENSSEIIKSKYVLTANTKYGQIIEIHANDIFDYKSYGNGIIGNFGFSIANQRLHISNKINKSNPVEVVQRRFFDFFTGVIYTDLMGLNTNSSNSLVNAQASLLMPMNLGNWAESTALRQFRLNINVALNNSFENEARYIGFKDSDKVNHFDLYRKQNLGAMLSIDFLSYESKGWFLTSSLGYNLGFYRTGYQYTKTIADANDDVSTGQLMSISHGPYLNFEFRPQDNFGADIMISLDELNINDDDVIDGMSFSDDILEDDKSNAFLAKHNIVNVSTNFYWLTNPGKSDGGVYAKIGLAYHIPTESSFPQLMVGYATNLTSFVNRFKQKESVTKPDSK